MLTDLIQNSSLLIALSVLYGLLTRICKSDSLTCKILGGILFGTIAVAAMKMSIHYNTGVIYDGRSIVLTLAGLFGGGITGIISVLIAGAYRIYLGGTGIWAGTATIITSALVGLAFRILHQNKPESLKILTLLGMGIISHLFMLLCQLLLPRPAGLQVVGQIWIPVMLVLPVGTLLMGLLLATDKKRFLAEKEIRESETLYRTTLHSIGDAVITTDRLGKIKFMNPLAVQLTGWKEADAIGCLIDQVFSIINEDSRMKVDCPVLKILQEGIIIGLANHTLLISKEGAETPIADSGAPIRDDDGNVIGVVLVFRDQSAERIMLRQMHESRERFRRAVENIPDVVVIYDRDLKIQFANEAMTQISQRPVSDFIGLTDAEIWDQEVIKDYLPVLMDTLRTGEARKFKLLIPIPNIGERHLNITCIPLTDENGFVWEIMTIANDYTKSKLAEDELIERERLFHTLADNSPVGIFRTRPDGYTTYVNPRWMELSGLSFEEALGDGWFKAVLPEDIEQLKKGWNMATKKFTGSTAEYRFRRSDGTIVWVTGEAVPELDSDGQLLGYIGTLVDITERKIAEKALRQSEENFRRSMDESPLGMRIVTSSGQTLYVNQALLSMYGFISLEEFISTPIEKRYTSESQKQHRLRKEKRKNGEYVDPEYEIDIICPNQQIRHIQVFRKMIDWDGSSRIQLIYKDFTERKRAEDQLLLLSRSTEQSPVSIVITDPKGAVQYVNPKFTETTGYSAEEAIGKTPGILKSGEHPKEFYDNLWRTIRAGQEWKGEFHNRRKNGELYWESAVISAIVDKEGNITHFVEAKEDITEKKKIIADLKMSKERAEESDRLKSAFLANMSHEIRTPLNAILGFSDMLTEDSELAREVKEEYSSIINRNADNLLHIIDDILDISKLETGQVKIIKKTFDPLRTLNELYTQYQRKIAETGKENITLKLKIPDFPVSIHTDKVRLNQILGNLLNNSSKFTHQGEIEFGVLDISEQRITFFVSDTGIGIEKDIQSTIFERFRQANDSMTRLYGGAGLGLAIVKNLVELMDGEISLESEIGKGTTFKFWLPTKE